jgi:alpha-L-fucosidase 2
MRRRTFLQSAAVPALAAAPAAPTSAGTLAIARRHALKRDIPTPNFFEGMLLGNGDIGVCVTVRPDALGLHIGKSDVWDIRVSEDHEKEVLPFAKVLELWKRTGDEAKRNGQPDAVHLENRPPFREYYDKVRSSYAKPWPRPWPCGIVWIHWDSRKVRSLAQTLDISAGVYTLELQHDDLRGKVRPVRFTCFVSRENGHIQVSSEGAAPVVSVAYHPRWDAQARMPAPSLEASAEGFFCTQVLPATAPTDTQPSPPSSPNDRTFALCGALSGEWSAAPVDNARRRVLLTPSREQPFRLDLTLFTSLDRRDNTAHARAEAKRVLSLPARAVRDESARHWAAFWQRSEVELADPELERIWYHNQYFLACCLKPGKVAPGLFGNWSSGNIGIAWHGDYHMNYNTQQVWWGVFSSNHPEQHEPYTRLVESLMPMAEWNARVQFGLPGVYFPHSAYPVPSKVNPYPVPPWGYEICETPWTVQSLWWEYLYTLDKAYLKRVYPLLRAATDFLVAYLKKGDDGKYHIIPTVSPENWGLTVDFRLNRDCIIDLALTEFLLDAMVEAARVLDADAQLREKWREVRRNLAPYPTVDGPYGKVWLDIVDAPAEHVYNVPVTLSPVFPCEQVGIGRRPEMMETALRTARTVRLEGGNDLVWQPLARARLGILDLDWFKREVRYCRLPNGVANDRTRQIGGRYRDETNTDFMMHMGVWTENLSLPAVVNECLMQSYTGVIRLFPNARGLGLARFRDLRAAGAFLVSAAWDGKEASKVRIRSEKGGTARVANPWPGRPVKVRENGAEAKTAESGGVVSFPTRPGGVYELG